MHIFIGYIFRWRMYWTSSPPHTRSWVALGFCSSWWRIVILRSVRIVIPHAGRWTPSKKIKICCVNPFSSKASLGCKRNECIRLAVQWLAREQDLPWFQVVVFPVVKCIWFSYLSLERKLALLCSKHTDTKFFSKGMTNSQNSSENQSIQIGPRMVARNPISRVSQSDEDGEVGMVFYSPFCFPY